MEFVFIEERYIDVKIFLGWIGVVVLRICFKRKDKNGKLFETIIRFWKIGYIFRVGIKIMCLNLGMGMSLYVNIGWVFRYYNLNGVWGVLGIMGGVIVED